MRGMKWTFAVLLLGSSSLAGTVPLRSPSNDHRLDVAGELLAAGRFERAERQYRSVLDRVDTGTGDDAELLRALNGLGTALMQQRHAREARALLERALRIQDHATEQDPEVLAWTLHALGRCEQLLDRPEAALRRFLREERLREEWLGGESLALARTRREITRTRRRSATSLVAWIGATPELRAYDDAIAQLGTERPPELDQVAYDAARAGPESPLQLHYLRALTLAAETVWRNDTALAEARHGIANHYRAQGSPTEALRWRERAWAAEPPERFRRAFQAYRVFPGCKAIAVALDSRGRYTYGFFSGEPTYEQAVGKALHECRSRLERDGVAADCRVYALHDLVVWGALSDSLPLSR